MAEELLVARQAIRRARAELVSDRYGPPRLRIVLARVDDAAAALDKLLGEPSPRVKKPVWRVPMFGVVAHLYFSPPSIHAACGKAAAPGPRRAALRIGRCPQCAAYLARRPKK